MANEEHVQILKQGVKEWNKWREQNPGTWPDLRRAELSEIRLQGVRLDHADLAGAVLSNADLARSYMRRTNLMKAKLAWAKLNMANLSRADLRDTDLGGAKLKNALLTGADLSNAILIEANLRDANLREARFSGTSLVDADLSGASLIQADFADANLLRTRFVEAVAGWTRFTSTNLHKALGLESMMHTGPSSIGIETLFQSAGNIPEVFLRGAGVSEQIISYAQSFVGRPIEFYSCFISFSNKDQQFAERVYADLQAKGVRCWFAPEDMKIGDEIRPRIDESIRIHDKLMLVLSEHSISSSWVKDEVEAALEKERRQGNMVLFPITLDDTVWDSNEAWAAKIRRERHIGDFRKWKDHDAYQVAFERLLRDLKAEGG